MLKGKKLLVFFLFGAVAISIGMELGIRLLCPNCYLRYCESNFSPRYHHTTSTFNRLLAELLANSKLYKDKETIVFIGDSFVEGREVEKGRQFTTLIQNTLNETAHNGISMINLGQGSFSTLIYERIYRDVVLMIRPKIVIICLDQTDMVDDYLYEKEFSRQYHRNKPHPCFQMPFENTVLQNFKKHKISYWLLKNSRIFLHPILCPFNFSVHIVHLKLLKKRGMPVKLM